MNFFNAISNTQGINRLYFKPIPQRAVHSHVRHQISHACETRRVSIEWINASGYWVASYSDWPSQKGMYHTI